MLIKFKLHVYFLHLTNYVHILTIQLSVKDNHLTTNSVLPSIPEVRMGPLNLSIKLILLSTMKSRFSIDTRRDCWISYGLKGYTSRSRCQCNYEEFHVFLIRSYALRLVITNNFNLKTMINKLNWYVFSDG